MTVLTLLTAVDGAKMAKTITRDREGWQKQAYDTAMMFDVIEQPIASIDELSAVLTTVEDLSSTCIIRGRRRPGASTIGVYRRLHDQPGQPAVFEEQPVSWLMIDFDDLPAPADLTNEQRLDHMVQQLPACFHDATFHYQWSSGAGLTDWTSLRAHLFFWLDRPMRCNEVRAQADDQGWGADLTLFNPVQVHYTAAPIFKGASDPLTGLRSGLIRKAKDSVSLPEWEPPKPQWTPEGRKYPPAPSFEQRLAEIGPNYHLPILKAAASYVASHGINADIYDLKDRLKDAIWAAPPGKNRKADYLCDRYLDRVIRGAQRKFTTIKAPVAKKSWRSLI